MAEVEKDFTKNFTKKIDGLFIDPKIFTFKFSCKCSGECCHYGVYTDLKEHDKIIELKDKILSFFDETQCKDLSKWFEPEEEDEDFESGVAVGTETAATDPAFGIRRQADTTGNVYGEYLPLCAGCHLGYQ